MRLRRIEMRVILPRDYKPNPGHIFKANPRCEFKESHIEEAVENFVDYLDRVYPGLDFRMVKVGPGRFNFICTGDRVEQSTLDSERR